jgi:hypothetical protein
MKFKVIDRKTDKLLCEADWTDEIAMPIRGDSFTFDGGPMMRIVECVFIMEKGQIVRVTFLVDEDVPARSQQFHQTA